MTTLDRAVTDGLRTAALAWLEEERADLRARLEQLTEDMAGFFESSRDSNADDEHDPEGQTIAFERSQLAAAPAQTREHPAEAEAARARAPPAPHALRRARAQPA